MLQCTAPMTNLFTYLQTQGPAVEATASTPLRLAKESVSLPRKPKGINSLTTPEGDAGRRHPWMIEGDMVGILDGARPPVQSQSPPHVVTLPPRGRYPMLTTPTPRS